MDVLEELERGNRMAVRLWLVRTNPDNLRYAYTQLAGAQDLELFRIADTRLPHAFLPLSLALCRELISETPVPEIGHSLLVRMCRTGLRAVSGSKIPGTRDSRVLSIESFNSDLLFCYMRKAWPSPWAVDMFKSLLAEMKRMRSVREAWCDCMDASGLLLAWRVFEEKLSNDI